LAPTVVVLWVVQACHLLECHAQLMPRPSLADGTVSKEPVMSSHPLRHAFVCLFLAGGCSAQCADLINLSLDDLAKVQVTSASRKAESLSTAPAAIYVLTSDAIPRRRLHHPARSLAHGARSLCRPNRRPHLADQRTQLQ
jgi:hypothetical protein